MTRTLFVLLALPLALASAVPTSAMSVSECSVRFFAAQKEGNPAGRDWVSFRQGYCGGATGKTSLGVRRASDPAAPSLTGR